MSKFLGFSENKSYEPMMEGNCFYFVISIFREYYFDFLQYKVIYVVPLWKALVFNSMALYCILLMASCALISVDNKFIFRCLELCICTVPLPSTTISISIFPPIIYINISYSNLCPLKNATQFNELKLSNYCALSL